MAEKVKTGGGKGGDDDEVKITVHIGKQGAPIKTLEYGQGVKLKEIRKDHDLVGKEIRVDGKEVDDDTVIEDQQTVVAVPPAVSGG